MLSKAPTLRVVAANCHLQPVVSKAYHISSISSSKAQDSKQVQSSNFTSTSKPTLQSLIYQQTRHESTITQSSSTSPSTTTSPHTAHSQQAQPQITWNAFFTLRKRRRWWQMGSSVVSCLGSTVGGIATVSSLDPNAFASAIPQIDPLFTMGAATFGFGVAGWMVGPFLGSAVWGLRNRGVKKEMELKEKQFFTRIKKFRVDPTGSSMNNPVPDYYGEKIASVQGYRRWLKDQKAFNKKKKASIL